MSIEENETEIEEELKTEIDTENSEEFQPQDSESDSEESNLSKNQLLEKQKTRAFSITSETDENHDEILFQDAIKKYYKLKNDYDESIQEQKKKILSMTGLSLKEKRIEFRKLKNKCVNCKRPVGSIFNTKLEGNNKYYSNERG